jgi:hypothetical protein
MKKDQAMLEKQIDIIYDAAGSKGKAAAFEKTRLADALGFIEHKVNALNTRIVELAKKSEKLETEIKDLQNQLDKVSRNPGILSMSRVTVLWWCPMSFRAASWKPEYKVYCPARDLQNDHRILSAGPPVNRLGLGHQGDDGFHG